MHAIAGDVHARHLVHDLVYLRDDDAVLECGGLDNRGRVFGVRARVQIAVPVGADRRDQGHLRCQVDEIPRE
ncbi:hypothetical protein D3C71_2194790 [compost metagenome]